MNPTLVSALLGMMGVDDASSVSVVERDLGNGRKSITVSDLPKPPSAECLSVFTYDMPMTRSGVRVIDPPVEARAEGEDGAVVEGEGEGGKKPKMMGAVGGVASSTSVDWYGTEMDVEALRDMAGQLSTDPGVPLLRTHGSWFEVPEWDTVLGRSTSAVVRQADVESAYNPSEQGYILDTTYSLFGVDKSEELSMRLDAGQPIGLSIGGWFRAMTVVYNEDTDELERIIIHAVTLDHVAVTRAPANPDSYGLHTLSRRVRSALRARLGAPPAGAAPGAIPPAARGEEAPLRIGDTEALAQRVAKLVAEQRASKTTPAPAAVDDSAGLSLRNPSGVTGESGPLDSPPATEHSHNDETGSHRSTSTEDEDMTPEQIAEIVNRAAAQALEGAIPTLRETVAGEVRTAISPLEARIAALEAADRHRAAPPAPVVAPAAAVLDERGRVDTDEVKALRTQVERLTSVVVNLAETPQRRGFHSGVPVIDKGVGAEAGFRSILGECRSRSEATALASVIERHITTLAEEDGPAKITGAGSLRNLRGILAAGLRAAEADGLIATPSGARWN